MIDFSIGTWKTKVYTAKEMRVMLEAIPDDAPMLLCYEGVVMPMGKPEYADKQVRGSMDVKVVMFDAETPVMI